MSAPRAERRGSASSPPPSRVPLSARAQSSSPASPPPSRLIAPLRSASPLQALPTQQGRLRRLLSHIIPPFAVRILPFVHVVLTLLVLASSTPSPSSPSALCFPATDPSPSCILSSSPRASYSIAPPPAHTRTPFMSRMPCPSLRCSPWHALRCVSQLHTTLCTLVQTLTLRYTLLRIRWRGLMLRWDLPVRSFCFGNSASSTALSGERLYGRASESTPRVAAASAIPKGSVISPSKNRSIDRPRACLTWCRRKCNDELTLHGDWHTWLVSHYTSGSRRYAVAKKKKKESSISCLPSTVRSNERYRYWPRYSHLQLAGARHALVPRIGSKKVVKFCRLF